MDIEERVINDVISAIEDARLLEVAKKAEEDFLNNLFQILDDVTSNNK